MLNEKLLTHLRENLLPLSVGRFRVQLSLLFRLINWHRLAGESFQNFQIMKRVHLLNHWQLLQGFRPRFAVVFVRVVVVSVATIAIIAVLVVVVEVPLSTPVSSEANRIVRVVIVIISTGRGGGAIRCDLPTPTTGVVMLVLLRRGLVSVAFAAG